MATRETVLQWVGSWPSTGSQQGRWLDGAQHAEVLGPAGEAFVRSAVRACWIYSELLRAERIANRCSEVRLQAWALNVFSAMSVIAVPSGLGDMELLRIGCPQDFHTRTADARTRTIFAAIDAGLRALAPTRGWSVDALDRIAGALPTSPRLVYTSPFKSSPDRQFKGQLVAEIDDDGMSRAHLDIYDADGGLQSRSASRLTVASDLAGMKRLSKQLQWRDRETLFLPNFLLLQPDNGESGQAGGGRSSPDSGHLVLTPTSGTQEDPAAKGPSSSPEHFDNQSSAVMVYVEQEL